MNRLKDSQVYLLKLFDNYQFGVRCYCTYPDNGVSVSFGEYQCVIGKSVTF